LPGKIRSPFTTAATEGCKENHLPGNIVYAC
jgi:hypothetical protein